MGAPSIYKSAEGENAIMAWYDAMMAKWPVPYKTRSISTRHGDTFVLSCGKVGAPPLVLLHGAGTNSVMWMGDVAAYSRDYQVYAVDLIGEPGKSSANRPAWASPAYAEWVADVLDALQIGKATLIGLSQGGWTALKFAVAQPERVENLILLTPAGLVPDKPSFMLKAIPLLLLGQWGGKRLNRIVLGKQPMSAEVEAAMLLIMTHFKPRIGAIPIFSDLELQRLTMPVLLLVGAQDALRDGQKMVDRLQKLAPRLTASIIPEAGHALVNTTERILTFLHSTAPVGGSRRSSELLPDT